LFIVFDSLIHQWYTGLMDDRKRTLAAITVIIGFLVLVSVIVGVLMSGKKVLSPVPEDNAIKIIFVSPSPIPLPSATLTPTETGKPSAKATPKPTPKATPKATATPSE
jgi:hypothetical protein